LFCRRAGNAVQWIKNGCFAGARELHSGRTKEQKLLSAVEITITFSPYGSWQPEQQCLHDGHRRIVMSNSIVITVPHRLGAKEAKRRIVEQIELLRRNYIAKLAYSEANWNGDTANLRVVAFGQTATAQVYVLDDALRIEVQLPWILAALTGKIQGILKSNAEESLRIGHSPPKA
jgi:Putative polyhydroxyalkanoic acid system protein (PHA_gran_rgn)